MNVALGAGELTSASIATALQHLRGGEQPKKLRTPRRQNAKTINLSRLPSAVSVTCSAISHAAVARYHPKRSSATSHKVVESAFIDRIAETSRGSINGIQSASSKLTGGQSNIATYPVDLRLRAQDRTGLLRDISTVLADEKSSVTDLASHTDKKSMQTILDLSIETQDLPTLSTAMSRLEQIANVLSVKRKA
jgi:GTP pyrophosphokinase